MDAMVVAREEGAAPINLFDALAMLPASPEKKLPKRRKRNWNVFEPKPPVFGYDKTDITPLFPNLDGINLPDKVKVDAISFEEPKHVPHRLNGGFCLNGYPCPFGGAEHCPFRPDTPIPFADFVKKLTMGTTAVIEDKVNADFTQSSNVIGSEENAAGCPSDKQPNSYCAIKPKHDHFLDSVTPSTDLDAMSME